MQQDRLERLVAILKESDDLLDQLDLVANMCIHLGAEHMGLQEIDSKTLVKDVLEHKKQHGETLGSSLALQGLNMMLWIDTVRD